MAVPDLSRREFLWGWFPFFWRRHRVNLMGVPFRVLRYGRSNRSYLHVHGNEDTARKVVEHVMTFRAGKAHLVRNNVRNVVVHGSTLDPNRMFSRVGAEASLRKLNNGISDTQVKKVLDHLDHGREKAERELFPPAGGLLIALHNNSQGYSVKDELEISDQISLADAGNPHEFFLCTDPADYDVLKKSNYNVVLQRDKPQEDDGSLSRLCARRKIRYLNLEVALGNYGRQSEMLSWADRHLK